MLGQARASADPWHFQAHPQVWLLIAGILALGVYAAQVVGPNAVTAGPVVTRKQIAAAAPPADPAGAKAIEKTYREALETPAFIMMRMATAPPISRNIWPGRIPGMPAAS